MVQCPANPWYILSSHFRAYDKIFVRLLYFLSLSRPFPPNVIWRQNVERARNKNRCISWVLVSLIFCRSISYSILGLYPGPGLWADLQWSHFGPNNRRRPFLPDCKCPCLTVFEKNGNAKYEANCIAGLGSISPRCIIMPGWSLSISISRDTKVCRRYHPLMACKSDQAHKSESFVWHSLLAGYST